MLRIGARRPTPKPSNKETRRRAPEMAKVKQPERKGAPAKAKTRGPIQDPSVEIDSTKFKVIQVPGEREAENLSDRYLNRYPDKACEVHIDGKLAYRVFGERHPSVLEKLTPAQKWMRGVRPANS